MIRKLCAFGVSGLLAASIIAFSPAAAQESSVPSKGVAEATEAVEAEVRDEAERQLDERREKTIQEAIDALDRTKEALTALEEERIDDALEGLAVATGKLELIVAREPQLALAPTDVVVTTRDLYATPAAIREAIARAEDALDEGDVQSARRILAGMGSEVVFTVTNLPLETYPDAIKAIAPLIDDGKIEEAKTALQAALNTLVLTNYFVPLPLLRVDELLQNAEELVEKEDRSEEDNRLLTDNLAAARNQLQMAELLGYGDQSRYEDLYDQLAQIEEETEAGKSGTGFFDEIKQSMSQLWDSVA